MSSQFPWGSVATGLDMIGFQTGIPLLAGVSGFGVRNEKRQLNSDLTTSERTASNRRDDRKDVRFCSDGLKDLALLIKNHRELSCGCEKKFLLCDMVKLIDVSYN